MTILPATSLDNPTGLRTLATWLCAQPGPGSHARSFSLMTTNQQAAREQQVPQPEGSKTGRACRTPDSRWPTMTRCLSLLVTEMTTWAGDKIQVIKPSLGHRPFTLALLGFNRLGSHPKCLPHCPCLDHPFSAPSLALLVHPAAQGLQGWDLHSLARENEGPIRKETNTPHLFELTWKGELTLQVKKNCAAESLVWPGFQAEGDRRGRHRPTRPCLLGVAMGLHPGSLTHSRTLERG